MCTEKCKSLLALCTESLLNEKEDLVYDPYNFKSHGKKSIRSIRMAEGTSALHFQMTPKEIHVAVLLDAFSPPSYGALSDGTKSELTFYSVTYNRKTQLLTGSLGEHREVLQNYIESVLLLLKMELLEDTYEIFVMDSMSNMVGLAKIGDRLWNGGHKKRTP